MGVTYIARISKPGFSVYDPDPKNFSLREDTNSPKAFIRGSFSAPPMGGFGDFVTKTVKHNLGYKPFVKLYRLDHDIGRVTIESLNPTTSSFNKVTDSFVEFSVWVDSESGTTFFYDIFYEGGP